MGEPVDAFIFIRLFFCTVRFCTVCFFKILYNARHDRPYSRDPPSLHATVWLIGRKHVQNLKHVTGSKSISQNPKQVPKSQTLPRVQVFLDSGTCFVPTSHRSTCLRINGTKAKSLLSIWGLAFQGARWWTQPTSRGVTVFFDVRVTHDNSKCEQGKATSTLFMEQEEEKKRK